VSYRALAGLFEAQGLRLRGGFWLPEAVAQGRIAAPVVALPGGQPPATVLLVGTVGGEFWPEFSNALEYQDGQPHPLDRWSARLIGQQATRIGAVAVFPSDGPPYHPFQRWAQLCEPVFPSPLGLLIHPDWGLWHAYRGALLLPQRLSDLPESAASTSPPCDSCREKPCLTHCPVTAFTLEGYDVASCARHLNGADRANCLQQSCAARRACPLGRAHHYDSRQTGFFMSAFLASRSGGKTRA
tara:strand:+ start:2971 stop:3696 length:726 start_codon:yes stop_codon:yes gene_type:complete